MLPRLGIEDIARYSQELGLELTPAEMRSMQSRLLEHIATFETFQELRIEEQRLPLRYTDRDPGYRPTAEEDPLNAFIRKCRIKGAKDGPLTGLPIGLMLVAPHFREDQLLRVAAAYQRSVDWESMLPSSL